ncbi:hypothetical protein FISHEDRAFT_54110 [Fistulina hepatica ATCC 64428]|uniref:Thioesterase domain-containing protein n=1 Tax=Fistulina hepatica ATCC 64428 TaxID=1128425 RepID=A0A0D7A053_9AGAR|nr:hypothetical protein FISHEDRAFT_54110 [Fistulina hepatica ATCC 64428]
MSTSSSIDSNSFTSFLTSLPPASGVDVRKIKGNVPDEQKQLSANALAFFVGTSRTSYGAEVGKRVKIVEINVWGVEYNTAGAPYCEVTMELDISRDLCNIYGTLHGGCAAYLIDPCSSASIIALGIAMGISGAGQSQAMNIIWHEPLRSGSKCRIVSASQHIGGRIRTCRCEIWDADNNRLCISAVHNTVAAGKLLKPAQNARL